MDVETRGAFCNMGVCEPGPHSRTHGLPLRLAGYTVHFDEENESAFLKSLSYCDTLICYFYAWRGMRQHNLN